MATTMTRPARATRHREDDGVVRARGPNFVYAREFVVATRGEETWNAVLAQLPPDAHAVWRSELTPVSSHPFAAFKAMTVVLARVIGARPEEELAQMYEFIADRSLSAIYKVFFRLADPAFVIRNYPKLWSRFFTAGTVEVPVAERGHAVVRFIVPESFLDWLPPACRGYSTRAVRMAGARELKMLPLGQTRLDDGEWAVEYDLRWE